MLGGNKIVTTTNDGYPPRWRRHCSRDAHLHRLWGQHLGLLEPLDHQFL